MGKSVAVLAVHGVGSQGAKTPANTSTLTFSKSLANLVAAEIGKTKFKNHVAWHEGFWADILQNRQGRYLHLIKRRTRGDQMRGFLARNISDAATYRLISTDPKADTYQRIHERIERALDDFNSDPDVDKDARLIILAHSLGGHIMSNYLYDMQKKPVMPLTDFRNARTTMAFVTFGCNIPLFTFAYDPADVMPIRRPGTALATPKYRKYYLKTWWRNYYDKDDILGYPLRDIGPGYKELEAKKELKDIPINAGGLFTSWNPMSHNAYWKDADFYRPVARLINKAI